MKLDVKETGEKFADWIDVAQGRGKWRVVFNAVMDLSVALSPYLEVL
jgi:hypothetical protein